MPTTNMHKKGPNDDYTVVQAPGKFFFPYLFNLLTLIIRFFTLEMATMSQNTTTTIVVPNDDEKGLRCKHVLSSW